MDIARYDATATQMQVRRDYGSFWRRLATALIDGVLVRIAAGIGSALLGTPVLRDLPLIEVSYAVGFVAFGATPAMHLLGLRVIDQEGNLPGWRRSIVRFLIPGLSLLPWFMLAFRPGWTLELQVSALIVLTVLSVMLGVLDPIWMIWDDQKQTLHDKLASTWVVRA